MTNHKKIRMMVRKSLFNFLIATFFCHAQMYAQPEPVVIQFIEAQPLWEHLIYDTAFYDIGHQPDINKYTVVKPHQSFRFGDKLVISSFCTNHRPDLYGYILKMLNIHTGEMIWENYNTYYNGGIQDHYKNLYLRPDGNLEMVGIMSHGPYQDTGFNYWLSGGGSSNYIRKVFDFTNGELVQSIIGMDSITRGVPPYLTHFPKIIDSSYYVFHQSVIDYHSKTFGYSIYELDQYHNLISPEPIGTIVYPTQDTMISLFEYGHVPFIQRINDTLFACLIFKDRFDPLITEAQILWFKVAEHEVSLIKALPVIDWVPVTDYNLLYFSFEHLNGRLYLKQPYENPELDEVTTFLTVFDEEGHLEHHLRTVIVDNHIYQALRIVYASDEFDYMIGVPSRTLRNGFDILKFYHENGTFEYLSSLTNQGDDEEFTRQMEVSKLYEDGLFIIGAYTKKTGEEQNSAVKYYAFNGHELGMSTVTSVHEEPDIPAIVMFPNPATDYFNVYFGRLLSGRIILMDLLGNMIKSYELSQSDHSMIETAGLSDGIYFVCAIDDKGTIATRKVVIAH